MTFKFFSSISYPNVRLLIVSN